MGHLLRRRPSPAMLVAIAALIVAMSGTAVAASSLVNGDKLIKKNSLSGNRLRNHSVQGSKIKVSSLGTVPNAGHASTADNATNATNAASATVSKITYASQTVTIPPPNFNGPGPFLPTLVTAACPPGTNVTGGGANTNDETAGSVTDSYPSGRTTWSADVFNNGGNSGTESINATVVAICEPAASTAP